MAPGKRDHRDLERSFNEIINERHDGPPKPLDEAAAPFLYALGKIFLRLETREDRCEQVLRDFQDAATQVYDAARSGETRLEQATNLQIVLREFQPPEQDLRKRRVGWGATDEKLVALDKTLRKALKEALRNRKSTPFEERVAKVRKISPRSPLSVVRKAADASPAAAARILIGHRFKLSPGTIANRISKAGRQA